MNTQCDGIYDTALQLIRDRIWRLVRRYQGIESFEGDSTEAAKKLYEDIRDVQADHHILINAAWEFHYERAKRYEQQNDMDLASENYNKCQEVMALRGAHCRTLHMASEIEKTAKLLKIPL